MLTPGTNAPTFELQDQNGNNVRLSDFKGNTVVLYFYPKAHTPGCTEEACGFRDNTNKFDEHNIVVLGVSTDSVGTLASFVEEHGLPFRLLSDKTGEVAQAYETLGEVEKAEETYEIAFRTTYIINAEGVIQRTYDDVTPEAHASEILTDILS